jgi:hypothetical protein
MEADAADAGFLLEVGGDVAEVDAHVVAPWVSRDDVDLNLPLRSEK